jgi:DNA-binding NtrC family response regulator
VAVFGGARDADALRSTGLSVEVFPPDGEVPERWPAEPPRIILLAAEGEPPADFVSRVGTARQSWPLLGVFVWAPRARPEAVSELLRAGADDVILDAAPSAAAKILREALDRQQMLARVDRLAQRRVRSSRFEGMVSRSHVMWDIFATVEQVAPAAATVLISGETGTGKELIARALHRRSGREGRFIALNCSAVPEHLIDSELFGHERGAFTGAHRASKGLFRHAQGGTLFLDEIGDIPEAAQLSLLRVLEDKRVRPLGAQDEVEVDVRVIAATNVSLEDAVDTGGFREDLFYRLNVIRIDVPPLRERPEDIVYLFGYFLRRLVRHHGTQMPELSDGFIDALTSYGWPGNVRELENFAERLVLRARKRALGASDFRRLLKGRSSQRPSPEAARSSALDLRLDRSLEDNVRPIVEQIEKQYLEEVLRSQRGRIEATAERAGISRRTLLRKLKAYGIDKRSFKGS